MSWIDFDESLIDFGRCDKPGIVAIEISEIGNIEQNNWHENRLLNSSWCEFIVFCNKAVT